MAARRTREKLRGTSSTGMSEGYGRRSRPHSSGIASSSKNRIRKKTYSFTHTGASKESDLSITLDTVEDILRGSRPTQHRYNRSRDHSRDREWRDHDDEDVSRRFNRRANPAVHSETSNEVPIWKDFSTSNLLIF